MKTDSTKGLLTIVLSTLVTILSWAQTPKLYTTSDGLLSSHISQMMFDDQDFLWVSTDLGLSRFNGDRFTNFQAESNNPYCLQENQINAMFIDRNGKYWVAGSDGLYLFEHKQNRFTRFSLSSTRQDISISAIVDHPTRDHSIIMTTFGWGFRLFDTETCKFDSAASSELLALAGETPPNIHVDKRGRLWGFGNSAIFVIDLDNGDKVVLNDLYPDQMRMAGRASQCVEDKQHDCLYFSMSGCGVMKVDLHTLEPTPLPLNISNVQTLALSPDQVLYIGTETQGLWRYFPETDSGGPMLSDNLMQFGRGKIHSIAFDSQNNLWLGMYQKGVVVLPYRDSSLFQLQNISYMSVGGPNLASVTAFAELPDKSRAYALDGAGVVVDYSDGQHLFFSAYNTIMATDAVLSLAALPDGTLLVGTYLHGVYQIGKDRKLVRNPLFKELDRASITDFEIDRRSNMMYIATNGDGLYVLDYRTDRLKCPIPDRYGIKWITNLYLSNNRLWISRADHLSCMNLQSGEIMAPKQPRSRVVISGFAETSDGRLWLASNYGLLNYDSRRDTLVLMEEDEQKKHRNYSALMSSKDGRLWLASAGCITMYDTLQHRFVDYLDPVITSVGTINYHSSKHWSDETFSFGGDNGVINFRPQEVDNFPHRNHQLLFTNLWVDNVPTNYNPNLGENNVLDQALWCAQELKLPLSRASFSVSFALQDNNSESGITYSYRLKGYENEWHQSHGGSRIANYHSLPSGDYMLEVCARHMNEQAGDSEMVRQLRVVILPPWYATWWAIILWLLLVLATLWILVRQFMEHQHARHELRAAETERQLKEGKLNLLTSVSHEIKTPLTLIISPLRKMMSRKTDPATRSVLEMMYRNSLRILMLVNQQMDVRKLDRGELPLHVRELPLRSFLDDLMQYFSSVALSRHITYRLVFPAGKDDMTVWTDPSQFDKVVMNLLSNAIKYVPDNGEVSVQVTCDYEADKVLISVYNSGSQLPESQQTEAFSGIGLSIAREITELHRGTLTVRNLQDGVAFDICLLAGKKHFTEEELDEKASSQLELQMQMPVPEEEELTDGKRLEVVASTSKEEEDKDRELVEQLNDELREKQRLRERRTSLEPLAVLNPEQMDSADDKLMRRVMDLIHKNMGASDFSVESLSDELGISRVHLNRKLKELLDISPSALIKSVRLKQAALLLIQSNVTVAEVAYSVGFSSPAYFTTNFTQYYGMTPKEFISMYTENPDSPELNHLLGK